MGWGDVPTLNLCTLKKGWFTVMVFLLQMTTCPHANNLQLPRFGIRVFLLLEIFMAPQHNQSSLQSLLKVRLRVGVAIALIIQFCAMIIITLGFVSILPHITIGTLIFVEWRYDQVIHSSPRDPLQQIWKQEILIKEQI